MHFCEEVYVLFIREPSLLVRITFNVSVVSMERESNGVKNEMYSENISQYNEK